MSQDSLTRLYRRYGPLIFVRCRRLLRDEAAAEDATQEVFLRVWRHLDSAPGEEEALRWIYRISTNYCLNQLRDRKGAPTPMEQLPEQAVEGPEQAVLTRDLALRLLGRMPAALRAPAVLHYVDGLEQEKVAATLGVSRRTVNYRLAEFAQRARRWLGENGAK